MWAVGTACLTIAFLISAIYLVFRHWRLSRDMDALLWRIDKKDIEWETGHLFPVVRGDRARLIGCGGMSTGSQASLAKFSSVFAPLVSYRERIFAAKALNVCHMDAGLKHQLKMVCFCTFLFSFHSSHISVLAFIEFTRAKKRSTLFANNSDRIVDSKVMVSATVTR